MYLHAEPYTYAYSYNINWLNNEKLLGPSPRVTSALSKLSNITYISCHVRAHAQIQEKIRDSESEDFELAKSNKYIGETGRIWTTRVIWTTPTITALEDSRAISDIRETLRLMLGIL